MIPDPTKNCGPYSPNVTSSPTRQHYQHLGPAAIHRYLPYGPLLQGVRRPYEGEVPPHADTVCQIIVDSNGDVVAGSSTNGFNFKISGYVFISCILQFFINHKKVLYILTLQFCNSYYIQVQFNNISNIRAKLSHVKKIGFTV